MLYLRLPAPAGALPAKGPCVTPPNGLRVSSAGDPVLPRSAGEHPQPPRALGQSAPIKASPTIREPVNTSALLMGVYPHNTPRITPRPSASLPPPALPLPTSLPFHAFIPPPSSTFPSPCRLLPFVPWVFHGTTHMYSLAAKEYGPPLFVGFGFNSRCVL